MYQLTRHQEFIIQELKKKIHDMECQTYRARETSRYWKNRHKERLELLAADQEKEAI